MEERIYYYKTNSEANKLIHKLVREGFALTKHKTTTKQIHFKKITPNKRVFGE